MNMSLPLSALFFHLYSRRCNFEFWCNGQLSKVTNILCIASKKFPDMSILLRKPGNIGLRER